MSDTTAFCSRRATAPKPIGRNASRLFAPEAGWKRAGSGDGAETPAPETRQGLPQARQDAQVSGAERRSRALTCSPRRSYRWHAV
jgi:hypothetical protein